MEKKEHLSPLELLERNIKMRDEIRNDRFSLALNIVGDVLRCGWPDDVHDPLDSLEVKADWSHLYRHPDVMDIVITPRGYKARPYQSVTIKYDVEWPQSLWFRDQEYELKTSEVKTRLGVILISALTNPEAWVPVETAASDD